MFRNGSLTLFRVRGVPIRAHWTLLVILAYLALSLSREFQAIAQLAGVDPDALVLAPIVWGVLLAAGVFASVALHELAHTLLALHYGGRVRSITLMLLGGVSELSRAPERPLHEGLMAAAGPACSLALGLACFVGYAATSASADLQLGLFYLAVANVSLAIFNLLPAFPMDGGRIVRAVLAARIGRRRATAVAVTVGRICAIGLGILAVLQLAPLLGLIAVFVYFGARGQAGAEELRGALAGLRVSDLIARHQPTPVIDADRPLEDAIARMAELDRLELVIADARGPVAVLDADDLPRFPRDGSLAAIALRLPPRFVVATQSDRADAALEAAAEAGATYIVVVAPPSRVIGLVGPHDVARALKLRATHGAAIGAAT